MNNQTPVSKKIELITLDDHVRFWEEARNENRHYFLQNISMKETNIFNLLIYNSKYYYDLNDINAIKDLYGQICNSLLSVRQPFNYGTIGVMLDFLISDNRFNIKPFDIPKVIGIIRETYLFLRVEWDKIVLKSFPFAYKTLLTGRYEIQSFLLYLTLEGCAHRIVSPNANLSIGEVLKLFLECLELPMSLYFDSFHLRKLLYKMGQEKAPAFSLNCLHPILTQMQYIFLNYFSCVESALSEMEVLKDLPWKTNGFAYLAQSFLVDNYHQMIYWKSSDYKLNLEEVIKPSLSSMVESGMPVCVINKLLIQGFYDIIELDCKFNFVKTHLNCILKDIDNWHNLITMWNNGIIFSEFRLSNMGCKHVTNLLTMFFYISIENGSVDQAVECIRLIHKFILNRIRTSKHTEIILKYLSIYPWNFNFKLDIQMNHWFEDVLIQEKEAGFEDTTFAVSLLSDEDEIPEQNN